MADLQIPMTSPVGPTEQERQLGLGTIKGMEQTGNEMGVDLLQSGRQSQMNEASEISHAMHDKIDKQNEPAIFQSISKQLEKFKKNIEMLEMLQEFLKKVHGANGGDKK